MLVYLFIKLFCILGHLIYAMEPENVILFPDNDVPLLIAEPDYDIDEDDLLAAKLSLGVLHIYSQWNQGDKSVDLTKPVKRDYSLLGCTLSYDHLSVDSLEEWQFKFIEGSPKGTPFNIFGGNQQELFGVIGYHAASHTLAVIFRGSVHLSDYLHYNLNIAVKQPLQSRDHNSGWNWGAWNDCWHNQGFDGPIHAGYYNCVITCQDSLVKGINEFLALIDPEDPKLKLIISGHSMGGALAAVFAGALVSDAVSHSDAPVVDNKLCGLSDQFSAIKLISLGAPRVSNEAYGQWLQQQGIFIKSFDIEGDLVTNLPPYQVTGKFSLPTYDRLSDPIKLNSYGLSGKLFVHDPRLYWYAMAKKANINPGVFQWFKLSINSSHIYSWSGLEQLEELLAAEPRNHQVD